MKASGYVVLSIDGDTHIQTPFSIDTDSVFMRLQYGDVVIETAHADHRSLIEHILGEIQSAHAIRQTGLLN